MRLAIAPRPYVGEAFHGYLKRLAAANGHANPDVFLGTLRLGRAAGPLSRDMAWRQLARWTGHDETVFDRLRWRRVTGPTGQPLVTFLEIQTSARFLLPHSPRACLACLGEHGIYRDLWSVRHVVACPIHACLLTDACLACGRPPSIAAATWPCACGTPFPAARPGIPSNETLDAAKRLAVLLGGPSVTGVCTAVPAPAPPPFNGLGAHDYLAYLDAFATFGGTRPNLLTPESSSLGLARRRYDAGSDAVVRLEEALALMRDWPASFEEHLGRFGGGLPTQGDGKPAQGHARLEWRNWRDRRDHNGLPLPLIVQVLDEHRSRSGTGARRRRNLTCCHSSALVLHATANATKLAKARGEKGATALHHRVLRDAHERVSAAGDTMGKDDLKDKIVSDFDRACDIASEAVSGHAAKALLEGSTGKGTLHGWDRPGLLPADPTLQRLRSVKTARYSRAAISDLLQRLGTVAQLVSDTSGFVPLLATTMRQAALRPWYRKPDLLLDVIADRLDVVTPVKGPSFGDLFIDLRGLKDHIAAREPSLTGAKVAGYASLRVINAILRSREGLSGAISVTDMRLQVRAGLVKVTRRESFVRNRRRPVTRVFYDIQDCLRVFGAGERGESYAPVGGLRVDITDTLTALRREGASLRATGRHLTEQGYRTLNGCDWTHSAIAKAVHHIQIGFRIEAFQMSFLAGVVRGEAF